jgi:hypothetical protein
MADSSDKSTSTNATTGSGQSLVEDVLRDAQALLAETDAVDPGSAEPDPEVATASSEGASIDLQSLVDRVDGLLGDLGHLAEAVESADSSASKGLDLTLVLPPKTPAAEHVVPDLGSAGPQVDLFATPEPEPEPAASEPTVPPTAVVLETEGSAAVDSVLDPATPGDAVLDDLAAALAAEFDQPELVTTPEPVGASSAAASPATSGSGFKASPVSATEVALMAAMTEEFGVEPTELPPVEDEGDPFESRPASASEPSDAAKRLESLLAQRLAEEYDLIESASTTTPNVIEFEAAPAAAVPETPTTVASTADATELVQSDIDAVARAEMEALEALGSELGHDGNERPEHTEKTESVDHHDEPESVDVVTTAAAVPEPSTVAATTPSDAASTEPDAAPEVVDTEDTAATTETVETDATDVADVTTPRPAPTPRGPSAFVRLGSLPFRVLPAKFHRHVTPVALSLAAWVPLAWGYAILGPKPAPPRIDVLSAGIHEPTEDPHAAEPGSLDAPASHGDQTEHATTASPPVPAAIEAHEAASHDHDETDHAPLSPPSADEHESSHAGHH